MDAQRQQTLWAIALEHYQTAVARTLLDRAGR